MKPTKRQLAIAEHFIKKETKRLMKEERGDYTQNELKADLTKLQKKMGSIIYNVGTNKNEQLSDLNEIFLEIKNMIQKTKKSIAWH